MISQKPDLVFSAHPHINALNYIATKIAGINDRLLISYRTNMTHHEKNRSKKEKLFDYIDGIIAHRTPYLVGVSDGVSGDIEKRFRLAEGRVKTLYNPAWSEDFNAQTTTPENLPFSEEDYIIVSVGRFCAAKNFPLLLRSFAKAQRKSSKSMRLVLVGDGPEKLSIESLCSELEIFDSVYLPGYVDNPLTYIASANLFVLSSSYEGFGNVIVEALGLGCPVISTDCQSGPAEILDNGIYGQLVPVEDQEAVTNTILACLNKGKNSDFLKSRAQDFNTKNCTERLLNIVKNRW